MNMGFWFGIGWKFAGICLTASLIVGGIAHVSSMRKAAVVTVSTARMAGQGQAILGSAPGAYGDGYVEARKIARAQVWDPKAQKYRTVQPN